MDPLRVPNPRTARERALDRPLILGFCKYNDGTYVCMTNTELIKELHYDLSVNNNMAISRAHFFESFNIENTKYVNAIFGALIINWFQTLALRC